MDAKKALYRAKLREAAAQKREKRIDSPLVKYNEHDQPVCRVCNVVLKSDSLWLAHQASRLSSQGENIAESAKAPIKLDSISSGKKYGKIESSDTHGMEASEAHKDDVSNGPSSQLSHSTQNTNSSGAKQVKGDLPSGFFDNKDSEATRKLGGTAGKQVNRALPDGFFDIDNADAMKLTGSSEAKEVKGALSGDFFKKKMLILKGMLVNQKLGQRKEHFLKASLITKMMTSVLVALSLDEYKEFEKLIQEDLKEVDERWVEEEVDAADMIEEEETMEQKAYWERVEMLKKKQMELKAAKLGGGLKAPTKKKDSSSDEEDSSSDEDGNEEDFAVDWRAKHL
ncbi:hypothetical protein Scep_022646 [Stephania cephalantha]|uniref:Zinc finger protein 830 n=1 Tax=Stephania cephalantha TaxID=152367 RepID=A0AAP0F8G9_9MAGN